MKEFGGRLGQEVYSTIVRYFAPVVAVYGKVETLLREPMGWQHKKFDEDVDVIGVSDVAFVGSGTLHVAGISRQLSAHDDAGKAMTQADVEAMIRKIADSQSERLDWQRSIVDLLKLLKLDSSLTARKQLAQELGYKGSLDGSAEMNIWLHKQVMTKLAETGGVVPESLRHA
jgi:Domain of unknown function (DUF3597)